MNYIVNGEKVEMLNGGILKDQDGILHAVPVSFTEKFLVPVNNEFEQEYIASYQNFNGSELESTEDEEWSHLLIDN